ncbi:chemoreceptor glutamine deamidase CheD [Terrarubrum flagellatum]|uniref:chemoreceptor glutamine deamidase CheD n=1 Tax=Terrirubrum flagellatum TaxID=2895980 RepID=UPI003145032F
MINAAPLRRPQSNGDGDGIRAGGNHRFYDASSGAWMVKVLPGEYHVTSMPEEVLVTILGSCVSACIRDPVRGIGGMNHFMLPQGATGSWGDEQNSTRFGNFAMEKLINELLKMGCSRSSLEIKVFGGGNVIESSSQVGTKNAEFVLRYLKAEGLNCAAQDLEGRFPRRIQYHPLTGRVVRKLLGTGETSGVAREETEYAKRLVTHKTSGDIELFE